MYPFLYFKGRVVGEISFVIKNIFLTCLKCHMDSVPFRGNNNQIIAKVFFLTLGSILKTPKAGLHARKSLS